MCPIQPDLTARLGGSSLEAPDRVLASIWLEASSSGARFSCKLIPLYGTDLVAHTAEHHLEAFCHPSLFPSLTTQDPSVE